MIVIKLSSGLGNQLFMYSFYLYLRSKGYENIYFDDNHYKFENESKRVSELDIVFPDYPKYNKLLFSPRRVKPGKMRSVYSFIFSHLPKHHLISENDYDDTCKFKDTDIYFLDGMWIDPNFIYKYICDIPDFKENFIPKQDFPNELKDCLSLIDSCTNAVSLHIRRGDYLLPHYYERFGKICTPFYFNKAIGQMKSEVENPTFFIFSEDLMYSRSILPKNVNTCFIPNCKVNSFWYIYLMSKCKHNIISNSTFSWWGAFLNTYVRKNVISPSIWDLKNLKWNMNMREWHIINV